MRLTADYHIHSRFSDGSATLEGNVEMALRQGLTDIALTEHGPRHLHAGIRLESIPAFLKEAYVLKRQYDGQIRVKLGIEANPANINGAIDIPEAYRDNFEVVGLGYHLSVKASDAKSNFYFFAGRYFQGKENKAKSMTDILIACMENNRISFLVHPGHNTGPLEWKRLARACQEHNVAIEISARKGHLHFSPEDAKAMRDCGAVFVVNSDSHDAREIGDFASLSDYLKIAGLTHHDIVNAEGFDGTRPFGL